MNKKKRRKIPNLSRRKRRTVRNLLTKTKPKRWLQRASKLQPTRNKLSLRLHKTSSRITLTIAENRTLLPLAVVKKLNRIKTRNYLPLGYLQRHWLLLKDQLLFTRLLLRTQRRRRGRTGKRRLRTYKNNLLKNLWSWRAKPTGTQEKLYTPQAP